MGKMKPVRVTGNKSVRIYLKDLLSAYLSRWFKSHNFHCLCLHSNDSLEKKSTFYFGKWHVIATITVINCFISGLI